VTESATPYITQSVNTSTAPCVPLPDRLVTLQESPQWAEVLRVLKTARNQKLAGVFVSFADGRITVGNVVAMESVRR
jgi:hypothetical protein